MSSDGKGRSITVLFCVAAVSVVIFFTVSMFKDASIVRKSIMEDVTIVGKTNGNCVVDTIDPVMSSKTINNCDLEIGTNITARYQQGLSTAEIVSP